MNIDSYIARITIGAGSHKGQNGKLLVIGGSELFHAASLWSLTVASRIVDLVHYASIPENNAMVKHEFRNGIVIARSDIESYIEEDDCVLIGPGMTRDGETKDLTDRLLAAYPHKQWVIDAGSLQMMDMSRIPKGAILTPHHGEFAKLLDGALVASENIDPSSVSNTTNLSTATQRESEAGQHFVHASRHENDLVQEFAAAHDCIVLLKGEKDIASNGKEAVVIEGGNIGMTKGGTGDVLAGLVAALACTSDPYAATVVASVVNKRAGDELYKSVGPFFNATDLANQIPRTMKELLAF